MSARSCNRGGGQTGAGSTRKSGRGGKIAAGSLAATVIGAVIRDLSRPNSLIRGLVAFGREKLLDRRLTRNTVDVGDAVEVEIVDPEPPTGESKKREATQKEV